MEYYVLMVKQATGASKYLVVTHEMEGALGLVVYDKFDDELGALAMAEYLNRG